MKDEVKNIEVSVQDLAKGMQELGIFVAVETDEKGCMRIVAHGPIKGRVLSERKTVTIPCHMAASDMM